jgi:hypothetical protein
MALNTGKKIRPTQRSWDAIPMPDMVIAHVNALGIDKPKQLIFTNQRGCLIEDVEIPGVMDFEEDDDDNAEMPILDLQVCQPLPDKPCCYCASSMPRKKGMLL